MFISALTRTPCEVTNVQNDTDWLHFDVEPKAQEKQQVSLRACFCINEDTLQSNKFKK